SPDGRYLAASDEYALRIHIWDVETGALIRSAQEPGLSEIRALAWSPNGRYLASGHLTFATRNIILWDAEAGTMITRLLGHTDIITSIRWSPDGRYLASGSYDSTVRLWGERPRD